MSDGSVKPIRSEGDYELAMSRINALLAMDRTLEQSDQLEVLSILADDWESRSFQDPEVSPGRVLRFLLESNDLKASDLVPVTGMTLSRVYEFLNDKRDISDAVAVRLGERFNLPPHTFKIVRRAAKTA